MEPSLRKKITPSSLSTPKWAAGKLLSLALSIILIFFVGVST